MGHGNWTNADRNDSSGTGEDTQRGPAKTSERDGEVSEIEDVSPEVREVVDGLSDAELRGLVRYVNAKLTADGSETRESTTSDGSRLRAGNDEEQPEGVPAKATRVVKEINDNRYHYWQWRDGESVKSKYDSPVDSG